ncbi:DUF3037 domain-containing protein [Amycolatopsis sp. NPDC051373]|uniref:DUF3037 domain-containing protein n=1 Tax=Amycolatopsis sp. NPDC051373 TaxID=3155801 RepID=UPI00344EDE66
MLGLLAVWCSDGFSSGADCSRGAGRATRFCGLPRVLDYERKKQQTARLVSDVAIGLFVERGFGEVTIAEVAEAADVSEGTVYNYFRTKEDLVLPPGDASPKRLAGIVAERAVGRSAARAVLARLREVIRGRERTVGLTPGFGRVLALMPATPSRAGAAHALHLAVSRVPATAVDLGSQRLRAHDPTADADTVRALLTAIAAGCADAPDEGRHFRWLTAPRSTVVSAGFAHRAAARGPLGSLEPPTGTRGASLPRRGFEHGQEIRHHEPGTGPGVLVPPQRRGMVLIEHLFPSWVRVRTRCLPAAVSRERGQCGGPAGSATPARRLQQPPHAVVGAGADRGGAGARAGRRRGLAGVVAQAGGVPGA